MTFIARFQRRVQRDTGPKVNRAIRAREVLVIDQEGEQLGTLKIDEAIKAAADRELDLVEVAPNSTPPVCRILDYGRHKYDLSKKSQVAKKHQKIIKVKEIKMRPKIDVHDYQFKSGHVKRFLSQGHRVKVTIMFRGREMAHTHLGRGLLERLAADLEALATPENTPRLEGRNMYMYMVVKPGAVFEQKDLKKVAKSTEEKDAKD